jgi:hypothetical protein
MSISLLGTSMETWRLNCCFSAVPAYCRFALAVDPYVGALHDLGLARHLPVADRFCSQLLSSEIRELQQSAPLYSTLSEKREGEF